MTDKTQSKVLLHVEDSQSHLEIVQEIAKELNLRLIQFSTTDGVEEAIKTGGVNFLLTDLHVGRERQAGYAIARLGSECGVKWVMIASESESPSQVVSGVKMMTKENAYQALIAKVARQEEVAEIWGKIRKEHWAEFNQEWNRSIIRAESEI